MKSTHVHLMTSNQFFTCSQKRHQLRRWNPYRLHNWNLKCWLPHWCQQWRKKHKGEAVRRHAPERMHKCRLHGSVDRISNLQGKQTDAARSSMTVTFRDIENNPFLTHQTTAQTLTKSISVIIADSAFLQTIKGPWNRAQQNINMQKGKWARVSVDRCHTRLRYSCPHKSRSCVSRHPS